MSSVIRPRAGRSVRWHHLLGVIIVLGSGAAWGANITVVCPGQSINDALASLDKEVGNGVMISGTCAEAVVVEGFKDLRLQGPAVMSRPGPPAVGDESALTITASRVRISSLTFEGPGLNQWSAPLVSVSRSSVDFDGCTIQDSLGTGLYVQDHSTIYIAGSAVADNGTGMSSQEDSDVQIVGTTVAGNGTGIAAGFGSHVQVSNWWGDLSTIENNDYGIAATRGAQVDVGLATIRNNGQQAVGASSGAFVNLGAWGWGELTITGNGSDYPDGAAVLATEGGIIWIIQPTTIEHNFGTGAAANLNGEVVVCCGTTPEDTAISNNEGFGFQAWMGGGLFFWGPALVEGNVKGGVAVDSSGASLNSGVVIRGNGDASDPNSFGGLVISTNSMVQSEATVTDNDGPGVIGASGSSVWFGSSAVITGNQGYGVDLEAASFAGFNDGTTVTGNEAFDLVCSSGAVAGAAKGTHPAIGKMKCATWAQLRRPPAWATP